MSTTSERAPAFAAAALAPAVLTGLYFLIWLIIAPGDAGFGPSLVILALTIFMFALVIAGLHILALAIPLYRLLSEQGTPGPFTVLISSFLIGALPLPLLFGTETLDSFGLFGMLGLSGGLTFLVVAGPPTRG